MNKPSEFHQEQPKPRLEDVLEHYGVDYKHRNSQMLRCPVHGDFTTPSCSVNIDKQVWNCHSCGAGGDAWSLIMQKEGIDYQRAIAFAASHGLADGNAGAGSSEVRGRYDRGGSSVPRGSRSVQGDRPYVPRWRRS